MKLEIKSKRNYRKYMRKHMTGNLNELSETTQRERNKLVGRNENENITY